MFRPKSWLLLIILLTTVLLQAQPKRIEAVKAESYITYHLTHPLHEIESTSKDVYCLIEADASKKEIKKLYVQIPVNTFNSGNSSRDSHAMEVIDAISFPYVKFSGTSITQSGDSVKVTGKLTFHGITKEVYVAGATKWTDKKLYVSGAFEISLTAFNVERPSLLMVPVKDILKFNFYQVFNF